MVPVRGLSSKPFAKQYLKRYKMPTRITIQEFEDELDALVQANPDDGGQIDALIEELGADSAMLETLCDEVPKWH